MQGNDRVRVVQDTIVAHHGDGEPIFVVAGTVGTVLEIEPGLVNVRFDWPLGPVDWYLAPEDLEVIQGEVV